MKYGVKSTIFYASYFNQYIFKLLQDYKMHGFHIVHKFQFLSSVERFEDCASYKIVYALTSIKWKNVFNLLFGEKWIQQLVTSQGCSQGSWELSPPSRLPITFCKFRYLECFYFESKSAFLSAESLPFPLPPILQSL